MFRPFKILKKRTLFINFTTFVKKAMATEKKAAP